MKTANQNRSFNGPPPLRPVYPGDNPPGRDVYDSPAERIRQLEDWRKDLETYTERYNVWLREYSHWSQQPPVRPPPPSRDPPQISYMDTHSESQWSLNEWKRERDNYPTLYNKWLVEYAIWFHDKKASLLAQKGRKWKRVEINNPPL